MTVPPPLIAIVAMANSIHAARWIAMLRTAGIRIVLVPVQAAPILAELAPSRMVRTREEAERLSAGTVGIFEVTTRSRTLGREMDRAIGFRRPAHPAYEDDPNLTPAQCITWALRALDPDLVHSMEVQLAGYLVLEAKRRIGRAFPPWILSNWGSDVYLFQRLDDHRALLGDIFAEIDGYWAECARDVQIARSFGYTGPAFDPLPASGGMTLQPNSAPPPSQRPLIQVKGYHGWAGRGLHILSAIALAADQLRDFEILVNFPTPATRRMIESLARATGLEISVAPYLKDHQDVMRRMSRTRIAVGIGISDGIGTTLLEAMSAGAFPIAASTSCACEWIRDGRDGLIVDPHDTGALAAALQRAATDDALVDTAAERNRQEVDRRWNPVVNSKKVLAAYAATMAEAWPRRRAWAKPVTWRYPRADGDE